METFYQILAIMATCFLIWWLYKGIKSNPEAFSKKNFSKSFMTMGLLALGLMAFVYILVLIVQS